MLLTSSFGTERSNQEGHISNNWASIYIKNNFVLVVFVILGDDKNQPKNLMVSKYARLLVLKREILYWSKREKFTKVNLNFKEKEFCDLFGTKS